MQQHILVGEYFDLHMTVGCSRRRIRDQLGHSYITVDVYGHLVPEGDRQFVYKLMTFQKFLTNLEGKQNGTF